MISHCSSHAEATKKQACDLLAAPVCCRSGEDHRSLTDVLQDLQGQLSSQEPKLTPGQTLSRPLHVVLQVTLRCLHAPELHGIVPVHLHI